MLSTDELEYSHLTADALKFGTSQKFVTTSFTVLSPTSHWIMSVTHLHTCADACALPTQAPNVVNRHQW